MNAALRAIGLVIFALGATGLVVAGAAPQPPAVQVDADGSVHVPAHVVPMSPFLSAEGRRYLLEHLQNVQRPELLGPGDGVPPLIAGYLARQKQRYAVDRADIRIAGVPAYDYRPRGGIAEGNRERVLINLHGGGFMGCWPGCAELESLPIAATGAIRVLALNYRQGPEHRHPAASEDVATVYRELLKTYRPENIGLYGCSAGGLLAGMSVAWFQKQGLPRPGAIGVLCAGLTVASYGFFGGDAAYTAMAIGESRAPATPPAAGAPDTLGIPYLAGQSATDPLIAPASDPAVLARFPPTLIVSGTRSFELGSAVHTHALLVKQGVPADLHVWEGMFHGFFYNADVPESQDCFDVIVRFFERHLGSR